MKEYMQSLSGIMQICVIFSVIFLKPYYSDLIIEEYLCKFWNPGVKPSILDMEWLNVKLKEIKTRH